MFDKNLTDLVRGIRNNKENEVSSLYPFFFFLRLSPLFFYLFQAKYIAQCMEDIKQELRQDNLSVKSNAIAKLTYVSFFQRGLLRITVLLFSVANARLWYFLGWF